MKTIEIITRLNSILDLEDEGDISLRQANAIREAIELLRGEASDKAPCISVNDLIGYLDQGDTYVVGDIVLDKNGQRWRLVDLRPENGKTRAILMTETVFTYAPFARPDKEHPWGWNNYEHSQIRKELETEWVERFFEGESELLSNYLEYGKLFLMSDEELGYKQTPETFQYFQTEDADELFERLRLKDYDGDETCWFHRSPYPGNANYVRYTHLTGASYNSTAYNGIGAAAACKIIF